MSKAQHKESKLPVDKYSQYDSKDFEVFLGEERGEMLRYLPKSASTFLDVGCAVGSFGKLVKSRRAVEYWGIEVNEQATQVAAQYLDKVICGCFDQSLNLPKGYFDCIVFNDVLEHMVDPYTALLFAKQLLKPDGVVVASIPNVRYFDNIWKLIVDKDWKYTENGILDRTHLRFFTRKSIVATLMELGYAVEVLEGINPLEEKHPWYRKKFLALNFLFFNHIEDMRYLQFAVVASPCR